MSVKTRYLQLSLTTMLEYNIEEDNKDFINRDFTFQFTQLKDGHYLLFNPLSYEAVKSENVYNKKSIGSFLTMNTINHTAVPTDRKDSEWFWFVDNDYEYTNANNIDILEHNDIKVKSYLPYCIDPINNCQGFYYGTCDNDNIKWDNIKLYFSTGYDFSDIYGELFRLYVETDNGKYLDLCNIFFTKSNVYKYITYMTKPIIFGNVVYDKYLNIKIVSLNNLPHILENIPDCDVKSDLHISKNPPIKILFSYVEDENFTLEKIKKEEHTLFYNNEEENDSVKPLCYFSRTSSIKGTIPREKINSDNIGLYIANVPNYPYIEFYGMWKGLPLSTEIVQKFNIDIPLYNSSVIRKEHVYEISKDYKVEYNLKKWIAMHEIEANIIEEGEGGKFEIIKSETYTQAQSFIGDKYENLKFYYRPIIFDDELTLKISRNECAMVINYTLRLMNIEDSVQFIKKGSITLHGNDLMKFCHKTTSLNFSDRLPYKVYNKIVEQKQVISSQNQMVNGLTKYVKHFYDSTTIVLDLDGSPISNNQYTMRLSQAPKNYKFVFKSQDINNNLNYLDLTDSYYKLFTHDIYGNEIIIEPTYSNNMNLLLGELEFNIGGATINKLKEVPQSDRQMTIVAYNVDNTTSAMYDFYYTF